MNKKNLYASVFYFYNVRFCEINKLAVSKLTLKNDAVLHF